MDQSPPNRKFFISVWCGTILVLGLLLYKYRHGVNSYIRLQDYADSYLPIFKSMGLSGLFSLEETFDPFLGGIKRNALGSEFNIGNIIHSALPTLYAVILNEFIIRMTAFTGLFLLLEKSIKIKITSLSFATATAFAVLPFFPSIYLTISGLPLVAWALINISRDEASYPEYIICFIFPIFSAIQGLPGILLFITAMVCIHWLVEKHFSRRVLVIICVMTLLFFLSEWRLIYLNFIDQEFTSHRVERISRVIPHSEQGEITALWLQMGKGIVTNEIMHAASYHNLFLLPYSFVVLIFALFDNSETGHHKTLRTWIFHLVILLDLSVIIRLVSYLLEPYFSILTSFSLERITWMYPPFFYILFAISGAYMFTRFKYILIKCFAIAIILFNGIYTFIFSTDIYQDMLGSYNGMTYAEFYAKPLFKKIKKYLAGKYVNRVASIGLNPAVALYHGFRTADGYWYIYDIKYKQKFRAIINNELEQNEKLQKYYDDWGSRAYMFFSDQKTHTWRRPKRNQPTTFSYNTEALRELHVSHVFSAIKVKNATELEWKYEETFTSESIPYSIYLYSL